MPSARCHRPKVRFGPGEIVLSAGSPAAGRCVAWWPVNVLHRIAARAETATNIGLGLAFAAVLAADTAVTAGRHSNWVFELAVGAIVCVVALLRGQDRVRAAALGLAVCAVAGVAGDLVRVPSQPGAAATIGLMVLGAAAVRVTAARAAAVVAIAGSR